MRVAFVSDRDVQSRKASTHHAMFVNLSPRVESLVHIRTATPPTLLDKVRRKLFGNVRKFDAAWVRKRRASARKVLDANLKPGAFDVVFAPSGSIAIAEMPDHTPIVYSSDATVRRMVGYYDSHTGLDESLLALLDELEANAIKKSSALIYPTRWVAESAMNEYGADPDKTIVAPWGANVDRPPQAPEARENKGRLLMMGLEWQRKGADTAAEAVRLLRERGIDVSLTVVGCVPPPGFKQEGVTLQPFFNKDTAEGFAQFENAMHEHDVFLFPSKAECFGHVACEAAAYAMPLVAADTGGVPEIVREGETGFLVKHEEGPAGYADRIERLLNDPALYASMASKARQDYEHRLNWDAWADRTEATMRALV